MKSRFLNFITKNFILETLSNKLGNGYHVFIRIFVISLITFIQISGLIAQSFVVDLTQCWEKTLETHIMTTNKKLVEETEKLRSKNIENQWKPQIGIVGQATYQSDAINLNLLIPDPSTQPVSFVRRSIESPRDQYKIYVEAQQPIYLGGQKRYALQNNFISSQIEQMKNDIELRKLIEQVNNLYFQILLNRKRLELSRVVLQNLKEKEKSISAAIRNGILQESDLDAIRIEILKINQAITEQKFLNEGLYSNLSEITSLQFSDSIELKIPQISFIDSIPGKKLEEFNFESLQKQVENASQISIAKRRPTVVAFVQAGYGKPALNMLSTSFEPYYILGVSLRWTIYDWNSSRNERQQLMLQKQQIGNQLSTFKQAINLNCRMSKTRIEQLTKALQTDSAIVELRQKITQRSSNRLDKGLIFAVDYINDLNAEHQARIQLETDYILWIQEKVNYSMLNGSIETLVLQKK